LNTAKNESGSSMNKEEFFKPPFFGASISKVILSGLARTSRVLFVLLLMTLQRVQKVKVEGADWASMLLEVKVNMKEGFITVNVARETGLAR